jgi:hypothetical protein
MKTSANNRKGTKAVRNTIAAGLIAGVVLGPSAASAGLADKIQQIRGNVTELKNTVQGKIENIQGKIEDMDGEGLEQLTETVRSLFEFVKQAQAGYKEFVGADKCGASSPCGAFRTEFRNLIRSFITLPQELPFVEQVPSAVRQLEKMVPLIDILPPVILFASEKVLGNAFEEMRYRLELVRYAASQMPKLPTMAELSRASADSTTPRAATSASDQTGSKGKKSPKNPSGANSQQPTDPEVEPVPSFPFCVKVLDTGKPALELFTKTIEHLGDFVWDRADMMADTNTAGTAPGATTSWKNPSKATVQTVGLVIKGIRQVVEISVAATALICANHGYKAP